MDASTGLLVDASRDQVQLIMFADFKPNMFVVMKRIWNRLSLNYIAVKNSAPFQIRDVEGDMIKVSPHKNTNELISARANLSRQLRNQGTCMEGRSLLAEA